MLTSGFMNRRRFLQGASAAGPAALAQSRTNSTNIVYLHSHDTGRFIQPYGYAVPTPNLQKLAEGGVLFRQAFNAAPTCSPSRASLLTGCCPHSNGMLGLVNRGWVMPDYSKHIVHTLRSAGYSTSLLGLQHVARNPDIIGFDKVVRPKSTRVEDVTPVALDFLNHAPRQPFFIDVGFFETHRPFRKAPAEESRYSFAAPPLPDTPQTRQDIADFKNSARALDNAAGEILNALESTACLQYAGHLDHRPRDRFPRHEVQSFRLRHGRITYHAGSGSVFRRKGVRRHGVASRRLPHPMRSPGNRTSGVAGR